MTRENRSAFLTQHDVDLQAVEDYLSGAQCGGLGESALRDFALRPNREFSVGFVSLDAGLLLAAKSLQRTALCSIAETRGDLTTLNFLNGGLLNAWSPADDNCELSCQTRCATIQPKG